MNYILTATDLDQAARMGPIFTAYTSVVKLFKNTAMLSNPRIVHDKIYSAAQSLVEQHPPERPVFIDLMNRKVNFAYHPFSQRVELPEHDSNE